MTYIVLSQQKIRTMTDIEERFSRRIIADIDYTVRDDIIDQLINFTTCPIKQETTDDMVLFHDQCYDREDFQEHVNLEKERNERLRRSGYPLVECGRLRDPRTGIDFADIKAALREHYHVHMQKADLRRIIKNRISDLRTDAEVDEFLYPQYATSINGFVDHIQMLSYERESQRKHYHEMLLERRRSAVTNRAMEARVAAARAVNRNVPAQPTANPTEGATSDYQSESSEDSTFEFSSVPFGSAGNNTDDNNNSDVVRDDDSEVEFEDGDV